MPIQTYSGGDLWSRKWSVAIFTQGGAALELSAGVGQPRGKPEKSAEIDLFEYSRGCLITAGIIFRPWKSRGRRGREMPATDRRPILRRAAPNLQRL
jgi:hypothetical protein